MIQKVALGLGSNLGDRAAHLRAALELLRASLTTVVVSSVYESPALLKEGAPKEWDKPFYNMVVTGETSLSPLGLLTLCQQIEQELGRQKQGVWSPRVMDVDILLYGKEAVELPHLRIPHPQMQLRDFVMLPLAEIDPDWAMSVPSSGVSAVSIGGLDAL